MLMGERAHHSRKELSEGSPTDKSVIVDEPGREAQARRGAGFLVKRRHEMEQAREGRAA